MNAGNPTHGKQMYKDAMDDSVYHILHVFLKPVTLAGLAATAISLPKILTAPATSLTVLQKFLGFPLRVAIKPATWQKLFSHWPLRGMKNLYDGLTSWGQGVEASLAARSKWVRKLMLE